MADAAADDVGLRQRRVVAAGLTEVALEPVGGAEHAALALELGQQRLAGVGHVLAEDADALVGRHLLVQRAPDGLAHRHPLTGLGIGLRTGLGVGIVHRLDDGQHRDVVGDAGRVRSGSRRAPRHWPSATASTASARMAAASSGREHAALDQRGLEPVDGVVGGLDGQLLRRPVGRLGVGRRVRVGPDDVGVQQRGTDAGPHVLDHRPGRVRRTAK